MGDGLDLGTARREEGLHLGAGRGGAVQGALQDPGKRRVQAVQGGVRRALQPGAVGPFGRQPAGRDRRGDVPPRGPGVPRTGRTGSVDLVAPGGERGLVEGRADLIDLAEQRQCDAFHQPGGGQRLPQRTDRLVVPCPDEQVPGAAADRGDRLVDVIHGDRHGGVHRREVGDRRGFGDTVTVGAQPRCAAARQRVDDLGTCTGVPDGEPPPGGSTLGGHQCVGRFQHPGQRPLGRGVGGHRKQTALDRGGGPGGVRCVGLHGGDAGSTPFRGRFGGDVRGADAPAEGDGHVATIARPVSGSAIDRTRSRMPSARKASSRRYSG